jgi:putative hydrolase of the HAD superfamily
VKAIFFDLDDTLIYEEATDAATIVDVARDNLPDLDVPPQRLVDVVRQVAGEQWAQSGAYDYARRIQTSPIEALYGDHSGDRPPQQTLHRYIDAGYRERVWRLALQSLGRSDAEARAPALAQAFARVRAERHLAFPDAGEILERLAASYRLALITNGSPGLQRAKLAGSGFGPYFEQVIVSGDLGVGKPDPAIYQHALELVEAKPADAVMIGNSLERDVVGAQAMGIRGVWFNPDGADPGSAAPWRVIARLAEVPSLVEP